MIPQVETLPVASLLSLPLQMSTPPLPLSFTSLPLSLVLSLLPHLTPSSSLSQIKEAADIIQKLHLIAQELPFDR